MQKLIFLHEASLKKVHQEFIDKGWTTIYYNHDDDIENAINLD